MKFGDKVQFGNYEELISNLIQIQVKLTNIGSTITILNRNDYVGFGVKNIVIYAAKQVEQLCSYLDAPIEILAWKARNLFESYLLSEYIIKYSSKAKEFIAQIAVDELQINEGFLGLSDANTSDLIKDPILDRNKHIRTTLSKHGLNESNYWSVPFLAKQVDCVNEYEAFFKLYSKYVHPSSWLINGKKTQYDTENYRNVFILQAQYYSSCLLATSEKFNSAHKLN